YRFLRRRQSADHDLHAQRGRRDARVGDADTQGLWHGHVPGGRLGLHGPDGAVVAAPHHLGGRFILGRGRRDRERAGYGALPAYAAGAGVQRRQNDPGGRERRGGRRDGARGGGGLSRTGRGGQDGVDSGGAGGSRCAHTGDVGAAGITRGG